MRPDIVVVSVIAVPSVSGRWPSVLFAVLVLEIWVGKRAVECTGRAQAEHTANHCKSDLTEIKVNYLKQSIFAVCCWLPAQWFGTVRRSNSPTPSRFRCRFTPAKTTTLSVSVTDIQRDRCSDE